MNKKFTAMQIYDSNDTSDLNAVDKIRFYCSIAMSADDYFDAERLFNDAKVLTKKAWLYEKLRRMNPREFAELHKRNIETGIAFDELLDKWP